MIAPVIVADLLGGLDPVQRQAVTLVYFGGHTLADTARTLRVDRPTVAAALALAYRRIAVTVLAPDDVRAATRAAPGEPPPCQGIDLAV